MIFLQDNTCYVGEMKLVNTERIPMSLLYILEFFQMLMMLLILWPLCFWHGQLGTFINFKVDIRCHKSS